MKVDLKIKDNMAIASFTKRQITSCNDILEISSMLCTSLSFGGRIDINPDDLPDEDIIGKLKSNVRYAVLATRDYDPVDGSCDINFGLEKDLLKGIF